MESSIFLWILKAYLACFFVHIGESMEEYVFPIFIPTINEKLPTVLFINEGDTAVGVANVSIVNLVPVETVEVHAHETFVLYDALRSYDIKNDTLVTIHIFASDTVRPFISLQQSQPSIAIEPVSTAGNEFYMYDAKGYDLNSYCLETLSLTNKTKVEITKYVMNSTSTTDLTLNEFETRRVCEITDLESVHVTSEYPVVLFISGHYQTTRRPSLIDMLVSYSYWGKTFSVYPLLHFQQYRTYVRIFCVKSNTVIHFQNDNTKETILSGSFVDVEIIKPLTFVSSEPVFVTLSAFDKTSFYNVPHDVALSNPKLNIRVMPAEQYISKTYIQSPTGSNANAIITTVCSWVSYITFDDVSLDSALDAEITQIENSKYCLVNVPMKQETKHEVRSNLQSATFYLAVNVTNVNTSFLYNVRGLDKRLNCKTLIYGRQIYEHQCDVKVYEKNISCSGPPPICFNEESKCSSCIRLNGAIGLGIGSAVSTIALNVFCQLWYCPRRTRKKNIKRAAQKFKEMEEEKERAEKERIRNVEIALERQKIAARIVIKPVDNTRFYEMLDKLKQNT